MLNSSYFNFLKTEKAGNYFIEKAIDLIFSNDCLGSFHFLTEGLNLIGCDCIVNRRIKVDEYRHIKGKVTVGKTITNWLDYGNFFEDWSASASIDEYYFCKAYFYSFSEDNGTLLLGLNAIENYFNRKKVITSLPPNPFSYYIKGRLLSRLHRFEEALKEYEKAKEENSSTLVLNRIGRLKEECLEMDGLEELYLSFYRNRACTCSCALLSKHGVRHGFEISIDTSNIENYKQLDYYVRRNFERFIYSFSKGLDTAVRNEYGNYIYQYDYHSYNYKDTKLLVDAFFSAIENKYHWITYDRYPKEIEEQKTVDNIDNTNSEEGDFEFDDDYTESDFIDDVFDGDESNQWNVD